jgi:hypothetical protein
MYKIDAVLLNWNRDVYIKKIINQLLKHKNINNVIISHGKKDTMFSADCFNNEDKSRVICLDHSEENKLYGLSLRFRCKEFISTDAFLVLDDDLIFTDKHVEDLVKYYYLNPYCITSYYGRTLMKINQQIIYHPLLNPYIKNIFYRLYYSFYLYLFNRYYGITNNIALTKMMIAPIKSLDIFLQNSHYIEDFIHKNSKPLWNGEDIFFSLVYTNFTGNICKIYKPYIPIFETIESVNGISGQSGHRKYRYDICKEIVDVLNIKFDLIGNPIFKYKYDNYNPYTNMYSSNNVYILLGLLVILFYYYYIV